MALTTIISGTGTNSYVTVAEYHTYITETYDVNLENNETSKDESNLRNAFQLLDMSWAWKGCRSENDQSAAFPRVIRESVDGIAVPHETIPLAIKRAQFEYAYMLQRDIDVTPTVVGGTIRAQTVGAGSARVSTEYSSVLSVPRSTRIELLVAPYHNGRAGNVAGSVRVTRG